MIKKFFYLLAMVMTFQHCFSISDLDPLTSLIKEIKYQNNYQKEINEENKTIYKISLGISGIGIVYLLGSIVAYGNRDIFMATSCGVFSGLMLITLAGTHLVYLSKDTDCDTKRMNILLEKARNAEDFIASMKKPENI